MTPSTEGRRSIPAAAAIVWRDGKVLLVQKGTPPNQGGWAFPGGKTEGTETPEQTAVRECFEETALRVQVIKHITTNIITPTPSHGTGYTLHIFECRYLDGVLCAGDDAQDAIWAAPNALPNPLIEGVEPLIQATDPAAKF